MIKKIAISGVAVVVLGGGSFLAYDLASSKETVVESVEEITLVEEVTTEDLSKQYNTFNLFGNDIIAERTIYNGQVIAVTYYGIDTLDQQLASGRITAEKKSELKSALSTLTE